MGDLVRHSARGRDAGSPVPQFNPIAKVPVLERDDGRGLYDSPVIIEYLDHYGSGSQLIPLDFEGRIEVKRWEALADGITEAAVEINHEYRKPKDKRRSVEWFSHLQLKIDRGIAAMEKDLSHSMFCCGESFTLADIAADYALGYLDFGLADYDWRSRHPKLAKLATLLNARESFTSTAHHKMG